LVRSRPILCSLSLASSAGPARLERQAKLGCAPAHRLLDLGGAEDDGKSIVRVWQKDESRPPRRFSDFEVALHPERAPAGVEVIEML
jgi:CRISPR-associated protein Csd2